MKRSLLAFQALLASSAILCQTAEASATYSAPDQLNNNELSNSVESRINAVREGAWSTLLSSPELDGDLVARANGKTAVATSSRTAVVPESGKTARAATSGATAVTPGATVVTAAAGAMVAAGRTAAAVL